MKRNNVKRKYSLTTAITAVILSTVCFLIYTDHLWGINQKTIRKLFGASEFSWQADNYDLSVHFIDVWQGDSILIKQGEQCILIDTGEQSEQKPAAEYLRRYGVKKLSIFIATHSDSDHIGDFESIAERFPIDQIFIGNYDNIEEEKTEAQKNFIRTVNKKRIKLNRLKSGDEIHLGEATLKVLSPSKDLSSSNDNSLVIHLTFRDISFLFTGDISRKAEKELLNNGADLHSDVLKVGHHGSKSSNSKDFYQAVSPEYAVISVSEYDKKLPNRQTVDLIEESGTILYRTDINGSIIIASDGKRINTFCQKNPL